MKTDLIKRFQIFQEKLDKIEILVIINKDEKNYGVSVEKIFKEIKTRYDKIFNFEVDVEVKNVEKLKTEKKNEELPPSVLSKIDVWKYL